MLSPPSSPFFLPFQGRQYRVSMACPQGSRGAVDLGSFRCDPELSTLLAARGVWDTLRARLAQAEDLEGFVAELTDVLEKVSWQAGGRDRKCDEMLNLSPPTSASYIVAFAFPVYRAFRRTSRHKSCFQLAHNVCQLHKDTDPCFLVPSVVHNTGGVLSATIVASVLSLLMLVPACVHWSVPAHRESLVYAASCRHVGIRHFFSLYRCVLLVSPPGNNLLALQVLRACPKQEPPPAAFYSRLVAEIDAVGWWHLVSMDSLLTSVQLREKDANGEVGFAAVARDCGGGSTVL